MSASALISQSYAVMDIIPGRLERVSARTTGLPNMSMLSHGLEHHFDSTAGPALISQTRKAQLKRFALSALTLLSMSSVLTALIALKTAFYVWHLPA